MHVASLDLCKELYELSGWVDLNVRQKYDRKGGFWHSYDHFDLDHDTPAYDLGYLLRKLPAPRLWLEMNDRDTRGSWIAQSGAVLRVVYDTPEDAVAKLAIELFKQGVLSHDNQ